MTGSKRVTIVRRTETRVTLTVTWTVIETQESDE